jgi:hypothetical protein
MPRLHPRRQKIQHVAAVLQAALETTTLKRGYAFYTRDKTKEKIGPRTRAETVPKMTLNGGWTRGVSRIAAADQRPAHCNGFNARSEQKHSAGDKTGGIASGTKLRTSSVLGEVGEDCLQAVLGRLAVNPNL